MSSSRRPSRDHWATVAQPNTAPRRGDPTGTATTARPAAAAVPPAARRSSEPGYRMVGDLRAIAAALDAAWRAALNGDGAGALRLGEASHGVHRALIALEGHVADLEGTSR